MRTGWSKRLQSWAHTRCCPWSPSVCMAPEVGSCLAHLAVLPFVLSDVSMLPGQSALAWLCATCRAVNNVKNSVLWHAPSVSALGRMCVQASADGIHAASCPVILQGGAKINDLCLAAGWKIDGRPSKHKEESPHGRQARWERVAVAATKQSLRCLELPFLVTQQKHAPPPPPPPRRVIMSTSQTSRRAAAVISRRAAAVTSVSAFKLFGIGAGSLYFQIKEDGVRSSLCTLPVHANGRPQAILCRCLSETLRLLPAQNTRAAGATADAAGRAAAGGVCCAAGAGGSCRRSRAAAQWRSSA